MEESKKILVIAPYAFGYTAYIQGAIQLHKGVEATILYLDQPAFSYRNGLHKAQNFLSKLFLGKNLKKTFVKRRLTKAIQALGMQDVVFIIRPDMLDNKMLKFIKGNARKFIAYYYDSTRRFPRKVDIIPFFDVIYSYDKQDVKQYNLFFLTNYIFEESYDKQYQYLFFNISTNDYRFPLLEKLAAYLKTKSWSYNIQVYNGSEMPSEHIKIITTQKSIAQVAEMIKQSKIIVEIQRTEQIGLSFRVFEALGYRKKLITTNKDIVNYDFYNPQNILVLDVENINIPEKFVTSPYIDIDDSILEKYRVENWVGNVLGL